MSAAPPCLLDDLGVLRLRGPDAHTFLQGQLSNDVMALRAGRWLRAGVHTPQGRTLALLALAAGASDQEIVAILPRELVASVAATLGRYVLRAKVEISDESSGHRIYGVRLPSGDPASMLAGYAPERGLRIAPATEPPLACASQARRDWHALDVAAGLPQVYAATSGQFVAQMLNLDCIDAVSFTKGCYTGQEVIARAHYRGRVKRRMQRFLSREPLRLSPGDGGQLSDGRSFRVVDAIPHADGRCEFLAVATLAAGAASTAGLEASATPEESPAAGSTAPVAADALPLPYALPE